MVKLTYNVFGLCVRFCLAESSILSTNVNGKTCTKPVLYEVGIVKQKLHLEHEKKFKIKALGGLRKTHKKIRWKIKN